MATQKIIRQVSSNLAPKPVGPYSQAVIVEKTAYLSGVLGLDAKTMKLVEGGVVHETRQALINMGHILKAAGSNYDKVIKTTVLLNNMDDFASVNQVYKEFFTGPYPARSAYQVAKLPLGAQIEIEAIALSDEVNTVA